jgi:NAD-dependent SIR2 family protein deacetylase
MQQAGHPEEDIVEIHGPLSWDTHMDPAHGISAVVAEGTSGSGYQWYGGSSWKTIEKGPKSGIEHLQSRPACPNSVSRPDVICSNRPSPCEAMARIHTWLGEVKDIDLMLIVGTSARIWPATELVDRARNQGARIAVFNTELDEEQREQLRPQDWLFLGDPAVTLPVLLGAGV